MTDKGTPSLQIPKAPIATTSESTELHILRRCLQRIDKAGNLDDECKEELTWLVLERILKLGPSQI